MNQSLGQVSTAMGLICELRGITGDDWPEYDDYWNIISDKITDKQYRYLLALCYNKKINELNKLLSDWKELYVSQV